MSSFLLEILSEEIPAKMQLDAASNFKKIAAEILEKQNIFFEKNSLKTFITPRRISLFIGEIAKLQILPETQKRGPKIDANEKAVEGFLKSVGLNNESDLEKITIDGAVYFSYTKPSQSLQTKEILADCLPLILNKMVTSWPKLMRFDVENYDKQPKWIRPIRNICALLDDEIVNFEFAGLKANNVTFGHFLHSNKPLTVVNAAKYEEILNKNFVILDQVKRKQKIVDQINEISNRLQLKAIDNLENGLIDEVCGLCENPTALVGEIGQEFMNLPAEVLILTIKLNQKYFCLKQVASKDGCINLANKFIFISNAIIGEDNSQNIISGNQKVVAARLSDAKFFIEEDLKKPLISRLEDLKTIVFHQKLGSVSDKTVRLGGLMKFLSLWVSGANIALTEKLSKLCKNDLLTKTVAELPELQGKIGGYYTFNQGENVAISLAISEHYLPLGPNSELPKTPLGTLLSISDKIDSIVGLFLVNEKPTSSKDPFALRRATLGIIRMVIDGKINLSLRIAADKALHLYPAKLVKKYLKDDENPKSEKSLLVEEVVIFIIERLRSYLKENEGFKVDIVNLVIDEYLLELKKNKQCGILDIYNKVQFLNSFISDASNQKIINLYKRAVNIVAIAEKQDSTTYNGRVAKLALKNKYEKDLYRTIKTIKHSYKKLIKNGKYEEGFALLSQLETPIINFFDNLQINDENHHFRENRLTILSRVKNLFNLVADISKIEIIN